MKPVTIAGDVTRLKIAETNSGEKGFAIRIPSTQSNGSTSNTLGGGTLTLLVKAKDDTNNPTVLDTLTLPTNSKYDVGKNQEVFLTLASSTSPNLQIFPSTYNA